MPVIRKVKPTRNDHACDTPAFFAMSGAAHWHHATNPMSLLNPVNKSFCLHTLCESNYYKLLRLIPDLPQIGESAMASPAGKPTLHFRLIEKTPYTLTLELTHCFEEQMDAFVEPAVRIRAYLDAETAEVLADHNRPHIAHAFRQTERCDKIMDYKWTLNYFLEKWLNHCLQLGYCFEHGDKRITAAV
jgi:uncharacterized protein